MCLNSIKKKIKIKYVCFKKMQLKFNLSKSHISLLILIVALVLLLIITPDISFHSAILISF